MRRDSTSTVIRYTLAGEVDRDGADVAARFLSHVCERLAEDRREGLVSLGSELDRIGDDRFERALAGDAGACAEVLRRVAEFVARVPAGTAGAHFTPGRSSGGYCGDTPEGFQTLAAASAALMRDGGTAWAAYLNLATAQSAGAVQGELPHCRFLVVGGGRPPTPKHSPRPAIQAALAGIMILLALTLA